MLACSGRAGRLRRAGALLVVLCTGCAAPAGASRAPTAPVDEHERALACAPDPNTAPLSPRVDLSAAGAHDGEVVASIAVDGADATLARLVTDALQTRAGRGFHAGRAAEDVKRLFALGVFEDVRLFAVRGRDGLALTVRVEERPLVRRVFSAPGSASAEVDAWIAPLPGDLYDPEAVARATRELARAEVARGYLDARAGVRARRVDREHVDLCFDLDPGDAWHVERLAFPGASHVDREDLLAAIDTAGGTVDTPGKPYRAGRFAIDVLRIHALLYDRGLLDSNVALPRITRVAETHGLVVAVPIDEGPVYRLGRVRVAGRLAGPRAGYEAQVHEQPGAVFVRSRFVEAIERLKRHHHELAGEDVDVTPKLDLHRERATVDVTLDVERAAR